FRSEKARLGQPEINLGLIPGFGGTQRLVRRIGQTRARELIYLGHMVAADEALRLGLVNCVVPHERLAEEAAKVAAELAAKAPVALAQAKRATAIAADADLETGCRFEGEGCFVPERYGGAGFDYVAYALAVEELSAACAATGVIFSAHASLATWPILALGTEAQRQRYLPKLARGEWLGCFALSEPSSGSDAGAIRTTARRTGEHYVLNGTKNFITNGPAAQLAIG